MKDCDKGKLITKPAAVTGMPMGGGGVALEALLVKPRLVSEKKWVQIPPSAFLQRKLKDHWMSPQKIEAHFDYQLKGERMIKNIRKKFNSRMGAWFTGAITGASLAIIGLTLAYQDVSNVLANAGLEQFLRDFLNLS